MRVISAKYAGTCTVCQNPYTVGTPVNWERGVKGCSHAMPCPPKKFVVAPVVPAVNQPVAVIGGAPLIVALLTNAKSAKLKFPKALFLAPDGTSELRLSLAGPTSKFPGAIQVKVNGVWVGRINPDGSMNYGLANNAPLVATLTTIGVNPAAAAAAYGKFSGACSFCGKKLTDDRTGSSVEVGYGPKCAKNYGLPHNPTGKAKVLSAVVPVAPAPYSAPITAMTFTDEPPAPNDGDECELVAPRTKRFKTVGDFYNPRINSVTGTADIDFDVMELQ